MTLSEYTQMKQQIVLGVGNSAKHGELVTMLKRMFKDEINSRRRYEQIKTIGDLLEILEIRDLISAYDVGILKYIAEKLPNNEELLEKIQGYVATHPASSNINQYAQQSGRILPQGDDIMSSCSIMSSNPVPNAMSKKKSERIHMTLVEEIGTYWRDLGRNLGIAEGTIDDINENHETLKSKACTLLQEYEHKKADPQRWFLHLCQALEQTRRRDLSRRLQEIMTMAL